VPNIKRGQNAQFLAKHPEISHKYAQNRPQAGIEHTGLIQQPADIPKEWKYKQSLPGTVAR